MSKQGDQKVQAAREAIKNAWSTGRYDPVRVSELCRGLSENDLKMLAREVPVASGHTGHIASAIRHMLRDGL